MYFDSEGTVEGRNLTTGDKITLTLTPKSFRQKDSLVKGSVKNSAGNVMYEIEGNWLESIRIRKPKEKGPGQTVWTANGVVERGNQQYNFTKFAVLLNYLPENMQKAEKTLIAPTDTRFRGDQRYFENGQIPEAEDEKLRLEVKQRQRRKDMKEAEQEHIPEFFKEIQKQNHLTG